MFTFVDNKKQTIKVSYVKISQGFSNSYYQTELKAIWNELRRHGSITIDWEYVYLNKSKGKRIGQVRSMKRLIKNKLK